MELQQVKLDRSRFAAKVSRVRKLARLTQQELSDTATVAQSRVAQWERGKVFPTIHQLARIVRQLRKRLPWLTADWLIDGSDDFPPDPRALSDAEEVIWDLVRELGVAEARRRLMLVGHYTFEKAHHGGDLR